jgi:predicted alpha/beta hydrolase family esterase
MATRVFVSFDFDHDEDLRNLLVGQAKHSGSPFEIADWSVREPETGDWQAKIRARIRQVGQVAVICGHHTDTATGVAAEVKIARDEGKPYFLLAGRSSGKNKKPTTALGSDKIYNWTWDNLTTLIAGGR